METSVDSIYLLSPEQTVWVNAIRIAAGPNAHVDINIVQRGAQPYEISVKCSQRFNNAEKNPRAIPENKR